MTIYYSEEEKLNTTMFDYIQNMLSEFPEEFSRRSSTPTANYQFRVNDENTKTDDKWRIFTT